MRFFSLLKKDSNWDFYLKKKKILSNRETLSVNIDRNKSTRNDIEIFMPIERKIFFEFRLASSDFRFWPALSAFMIASKNYKFPARGEKWERTYPFEWLFMLTEIMIFIEITSLGKDDDDKVMLLPLLLRNKKKKKLKARGRKRDERRTFFEHSN